MTRSVYIKLDGQQLRISSTNCRIPKRLMWNEISEDSLSSTNSTTAINKQFTRHRFYNLKNATIEMCPKGLARKRYFSRKYPMQLIIKNVNERSQSPVGDKTNEGKSNTEINLDFSPNNFDIANTIMSVDSNVVSNQNTAKIYAKKNPIKSDLIEQLQKIQNNETAVQKDPHTSSSREVLNNIKSQALDEVRITLFARGDREKEDWYRRFLAASRQDIYDEELKLSDIEMPDIEPSGSEDISNKDEKINASPKKSNIIISECAGRCPADYLKFMTKYQVRY